MGTLSSRFILQMIIVFGMITVIVYGPLSGYPLLMYLSFGLTAFLWFTLQIPKEEIEKRNEVLRQLKMKFGGEVLPGKWGIYGYAPDARMWGKYRGRDFRIRYFNTIFTLPKFSFGRIAMNRIESEIRMRKMQMPQKLPIGMERSGMELVCLTKSPFFSHPNTESKRIREILERMAEAGSQ